MYIFWDNSNIHISGLEVMKLKEPNQLHELFRTDFKNLFQLVCNKRTVDSAYLSGSIPPPNNAVWDYLRNMGVSLQLLNKTADGFEQESVDMSLQTMMLRTVIVDFMDKYAGTYYEGEENWNMWQIVEKWEGLNDWVYEIDGNFTHDEVGFFVELFNKTTKALTDKSISRELYAKIYGRCYHFVHHPKWASANDTMEHCRNLTRNAVGYIIQHDLKKLPKCIVVDGHWYTEIHNPLRVQDVYSYGEGSMRFII